ncbi:RNB domain-containing ribonuclease [Acidicapsa dinghuensis]|uniref:RNB domain-containing ribonuclease n=1 Tax=Acidicapsa dinghuensis TaxID=2218256 RepID=A0ABW1EEM8_9BACT|nr:RNB domain-containing ribonuclease [Acidicapsa dinghuensis]
MSHSHFDLDAATLRCMQEHGFHPEFSNDVQKQLSDISANHKNHDGLKDLRVLLWSSIDNDDSKDLDQIEWAESLPGGQIRVLIGVADVDGTVHRSTPIDQHAASETTSVYTGVRTFPMLPTELSENLTSLNEHQDRAAVVTEFCVDSKGAVSDGKIYRAMVQNKAQLAYNAVGAWLEGKGAPPEKIAKSKELEHQLRLQDEAAQRMVGARFQHGALDLETIETRPLMQHEEAVDLVRQAKNRATSLIEEFMVAANGVMARFLDAVKVPSIRRIVRVPKRWERIVDVAKGLGTSLPAEPDSKALNDFLLGQRAKDPAHFPDLSLAVIKLLGPGEYVMVRPGEESPGHFGLAVQDYTHSTAPNRRFPDVVTQRLLKAVKAGANSPYSADDLQAIATRCTQMEDAARHVEREMQKRIAAVVLHSRIGQSFAGIVTGVNQHGTFVRALEPHVEGMVVHGGKGLDVGDRVTVKLVGTNPERGFIDFAI